MASSIGICTFNITIALYIYLCQLEQSQECKKARLAPRLTDNFIMLQKNLLHFFILSDRAISYLSLSQEGRLYQRKFLSSSSNFP